MNVRSARCMLMGLALCGASVSVFATATGTGQSDLEREAKVNRVRAEELALARAPEGTVKSAHLQRDNGKLVWWLDISQYHGRRGIVEVQVDATTGQIIASNVKGSDKAK